MHQIPFLLLFTDSYPANIKSVALGCFSPSLATPIECITIVLIQRVSKTKTVYGSAFIAYSLHKPTGSTDARREDGLEVERSDVILRLPIGQGLLDEHDRRYATFASAPFASAFVFRSHKAALSCGATFSSLEHFSAIRLRLLFHESFSHRLRCHRVARSYLLSIHVGGSWIAPVVVLQYFGLWLTLPVDTTAWRMSHRR